MILNFTVDGKLDADYFVNALVLIDIVKDALLRRIRKGGAWENSVVSF